MSRNWVVLIGFLCLLLLICLVGVASCNFGEDRIDIIVQNQKDLERQKTEEWFSNAVKYDDENHEQTEKEQPNIGDFDRNVDAREMPYMLHLQAETSIFDGPSYDFIYKQVVGEDGIYTIIEETNDEEGNLWGKLKSGIGWIDLTAIAVSEAMHVPITVCFADNLILNDNEYQEYIIEESEHTVKIAFRAKERITNVTFNALRYDENSLGIAETYYAFDELGEEEFFVVGVVFYGDMTTYGISFLDKDGEERHYAVSISGRNGKLEVHNFQP